MGIAINSAESEVQAFVDKAGLTFPMTYDLYGELPVAYGVTGVPNYFFLDKEGRIADAMRGAPHDTEIIRTRIKELQSE